LRLYEGIRKGYPKTPLPPKVKAFIQLIRPLTLLSGVVAGFFGVVITYNLTSMKTFSLVDVVVAITTLSCLQAYGQVVNQICDVEIDLVNKSWRPLPSGKVKLSEAKGFALLLFATPLIMSWGRREFFALTCIGLALATAYSLPPVRVKRSAVGSMLLMGFARGALPVLIVWSATAGVTPTALALSIPPFIWMTAFNWSKDFGDEEGDIRFGVKTIPIILGRERAKTLMLLLSTLYPASVSALILLHLLPLEFTLLLLLTPLALSIPFLVDRVDERVENNVGWAVMYLGLALMYVLMTLATVVEV